MGEMKYAIVAPSVAFSDDLPLLRPETLELRPPSRRDASQPVDVYTASRGFFDKVKDALGV